MGEERELCVLQGTGKAERRERKGRFLAGGMWPDDGFIPQHEEHFRNATITLGNECYPHSEPLSLPKLWIPLIDASVALTESKTKDVWKLPTVVVRKRDMKMWGREQNTLEGSNERFDSAYKTGTGKGLSTCLGEGRWENL